MPYKTDAHLVSLWRLEEATGTRYDYTSNNNDLTDNNTVGRSSDHREGEYSADFEYDNSEYLSITDAAQTGLDITGDITICFWCKPESWPSELSNVVNKWLHTTNNRSYLVVLDYVQDGDIAFYLSSNGVASTTCFTGAELTAGTWHHVACVYDGTDMRIYVDGLLADNGANNPKAYAAGIFNGNADLRIGGRSGSPDYYDGLLDEVAIFDRALTAAEVRDVFLDGVMDAPAARPRLTSRKSPGIRNYEIYLTTDTGLRIALLDNILGLTAARAANAIAPFRLDLPPSFDTRLIVPDRQVQVWRAPEGGRLSLWRAYFIRKWRYETHGAEQSLAISGPDVNDLLRRRIAVGYAGSYFAQKTSWADNMMKELVDEATGANADVAEPAPTAGTRDWSDYLSVAADLGDGPILTLAFAWGQLLTANGGGILSSIAKAAKEAGTEVFFDIVPDSVSSTAISFQFRTYTGQPSADRTSLGAVFDQERGNLEDPFLEYDHTEEVTYVYAGGQGEGEGRNIQQVYDATRYSASAWNRCEAFADARMQTTDNGVREAGRAALQDGRPRRRFGGVPVDTTGFRFGRDWNFGDRVRARYRGLEFDAIVRAVTISLDKDGRETVQARLDYED